MSKFKEVVFDLSLIFLTRLVLKLISFKQQMNFDFVVLQAGDKAFERVIRCDVQQNIAEHTEGKKIRMLVFSRYSFFS